MKYMLMIYRDEAAFQDGKTSGPPAAAYMAYSTALKEAGVLLAGDRLQPVSTASTVRKADGAVRVLDGPYADTREQLGGYYIIDVPDLDAALGWAGRCPGAEQGTVEVRPLWTM